MTNALLFAILAAQLWTAARILDAIDAGNGSQRRRPTPRWKMDLLISTLLLLGIILGLVHS